jgi:hypothetical protein
MTAGRSRYEIPGCRSPYLEVKRRLIGRDMDASDRVNTLLLDWLRKDRTRDAR